MGKPITSCDDCRRSRLGCNAVLQNGQACYNCVRKGVRCGFTPRTASAKSHETIYVPERGQALLNGASSPTAEPPVLFASVSNWGAHSEPPTEVDSSPSDCSQTTSLSSTTNSLARSQQALRLHGLLWNVFTTLLEPRIGLWIGGAGCPFLTTSTVSSKS